MLESSVVIDWLFHTWWRTKFCVLRFLTDHKVSLATASECEMSSKLSV